MNKLVKTLFIGITLLVSVAACGDDCESPDPELPSECLDEPEVPVDIARGRLEPYRKPDAGR
jgi:hypothetical protein